MRVKLSVRRAMTCVGVLAISATNLRAQGTVAGRVSIQEKAGEATADLVNTVIYFLPVGERKLRLAPAKGSMTMQARAFAPHVRVVPVGSTVDFPNQDPFSHNIFSTAAGFDLGTYAGGAGKSATFKKPGAYPVYCNIHAKMTAFVVAVPTPYFSTAGADGRWSIPALPAGAWEMHVWHERAPEIVTKLDIAVGGMVDISTTLDARGYAEKPHMNKFGKEYTSAGKDRY